MITYTAVNQPVWEDKVTGKRVSFTGAPPPSDCYKVIFRPSIKINENGRIIYCNYFYGKVLTTLEEAEKVAKELTNKLL